MEGQVYVYMMLSAVLLAIIAGLITLGMHIDDGYDVKVPKMMSVIVAVLLGTAYWGLWLIYMGR